MTVSLEALAMSGADFLEVGYDMDEFELIESEVPPYLLAEGKVEVEAEKDKLEDKWSKTDYSFSIPRLANFIEDGYNMDEMEKSESEIQSYLLAEDIEEEAEAKVDDNKLEASLWSKSDHNLSIAILFCGFKTLRKDVSKWNMCDFITTADYGSEGDRQRQICDYKLDAASWLHHDSLVVIIVWSILGLLNC